MCVRVKQLRTLVLPAGAGTAAWEHEGQYRGENMKSFYLLSAQSSRIRVLRVWSSSQLLGRSAETSVTCRTQRVSVRFPTSNRNFAQFSELLMFTVPS